MLRSRPRSGATFLTAALALVTVCAASGVPAPLYVVYQQAHGIPTVALTGAFAVYILPLLVALLCCGGLSDHLGRRRVAVPALLLAGVGCLVLAGVDGAAPLIAGRAVQGLAIGLALSSLGALVVDLEPVARPGLAGAITGGAPPGGVGLGALCSGVAVQLAPGAAPVVAFLVTAGLLAGAAAAVALLPETVDRVPGAVRSLRPVVAIPSAVRPVFATVCLLVSATYVLGGFTQALAPSLAVSVLGRGDLLSGALAVAVFHFAGPAAGLAASRLPAQRAIVVGAAGLAVGSAAFVGAVAAGSFGLYLAAAVVAGAGFGTAFAGSMRVLLERSPAAAHAGTLAATYLFCYLAAAVSSLAAGAAADAYGLAPVTTVLCGVVVVMAVVGAYGAVRRLGPHVRGAGTEDWTPGA